MTTKGLLSLAEGLTPNQQRALLSLSTVPQDKSVSWSVRVGYALERKGLAKRTLLTDRTFLTPLGESVSPLLSAQQEQSQ